MKICENCGKEHDGSYGSGRFCSKKCARAFSTKNDNNKLKKVKCIDCGKIIYINKRASDKKCRCEECKKIHNQLTCKICGRKYNKNEDGCKNTFCQEHNLNQINTLIKYFGFDKSKLGTPEVENEFNKVRNILYDLYWNQKKSFSDLSKLFNYNSNPGNFTKFFRNLNLNSRNFSECAKLTYLQGKQNKECNNKYHQQWHKTWNGKDVYLRSSYELDYAKELDEQKIDYEVECFHIKYWDSQKQEYRCAIPDFYIPSINTIVEIKSTWTTNYQELKDKEIEYKKLGYEYKLIFEHQEYESIENIDKTKFKNVNNKIITNHIYKQKDGYRWIYKDNKQMRCNKNDIDLYLNNGWGIGMLKK